MGGVGKKKKKKKLNPDMRNNFCRVTLFIHNWAGMKAFKNTRLVPRLIFLPGMKHV
jgi:hypothetical protein